MPPEAVAAILGAAAEVVRAAGGSVAGGHTIRSEEPIFGLAVTGLVHPDRVWTKSGARPGDALVLSKPIGTGIVLAGGSAADKTAAMVRMRQLNRAAAEALIELGADVHAVTDVTGFGLCGHGWEMAERGDVRLVFDTAALPFYDGALGAAEAGVRTGGDARNREYLGGRVTVAPGVAAAVEALCVDPQTSGGLLAAVAPSVVDSLAEVGFVAVGVVEDGEPGVTLR
jgi:selenide,water dikinase